MSEFKSAVSGCFSEASSILSSLKSELNNWNDSKATVVKEQVENDRRSFQMVCDASKFVEDDIRKMREIADKVESISRKTVGNGF